MQVAPDESNIIPQRIEKSQKEMLSVQKIGPNKIGVRINFSSLDVIQTCMRKAYYALHRKLRSKYEGEATLYGSAIHAGLETWYSQKSVHKCLEAFRNAAAPLEALPDTNKRSIANGIITLETYLQTYSTDGLELATDETGTPFVEKDVTLNIVDTDRLRIDFFGRIDAVLRDIKTGVIFVTDHKTTSSLGTDFFNRIRPNFQYVGYTWAAREVLGLDTSQFMVNGLQVKNNVYSGRGKRPGPPGFARQVTQITAQDIKEFKSALITAVDRFVRGGIKDGIWTMSTPGACNLWSGCQFRDICEISTEDEKTTASMRESIIKSRYN